MENHGILLRKGDEKMTDSQSTDLLQTAQIELQKQTPEAQRLLDNRDDLDRFLIDLEKRFAEVPIVGDTLKHIPILVQMVKSYIQGDYTAIPIGSIISVICALLYFLTPLDLVPDIIPGVGIIDDAVVVGACLALIKADLDGFVAWQKENAHRP